MVSASVSLSLSLSLDFSYKNLSAPAGFPVVTGSAAPSSSSPPIPQQDSNVCDEAHEAAPSAITKGTIAEAMAAARAAAASNQPLGMWRQMQPGDKFEFTDDPDEADTDGMQSYHADVTRDGVR